MSGDSEGKYPYYPWGNNVVPTGQELEARYPDRFADKKKSKSCPACGSGAKPSVAPADHGRTGRVYKSCPDCGLRRSGE